MITGVCETDFSGYPDCRDEFVKALNRALCLGLEKPLRLVTPLMWLNKAQTWALADLTGSMYLGTAMRHGRPVLKRDLVVAAVGTVAVLTGIAGRNQLAPHADIVFDTIDELPAWIEAQSIPA